MNVEKIKVDTGRQRQDGQKLNNQLNMIKKDMKDIYDEVEQLDQMWDGQANDAFNTQFKTDYQTISSIIGQMQKFVNKLDYARGKYEQCESKVGELIQSMRF